MSQSLLEQAHARLIAAGVEMQDGDEIITSHWPDVYLIREREPGSQMGFDGERRVW